MLTQPGPRSGTKTPPSQHNPPHVMELAQIPSELAGYKIPREKKKWGRGEKGEMDGVEDFQESRCKSFFGEGFFFLFLLNQDSQ